MGRKLFSLLCVLVFTLTIGFTAAAEGAASRPDSSVVDTILSAGTTQAFKDDPVSAGDLKIILQAGLAAESAINQQPWYFVAVTNPDVMKELAGGSAGGAMPSAASSLNGANHDAICEKLGVDLSMQAVAVLLIGYADDSVDAATGATTRESLETKTAIIE